MKLIFGHRRRSVAAAVLVAGMFAGLLAPAAVAAQSKPPCVHRVLVLTAMPLELNPLVRAASIDPNATVRINGRTFYVGSLAGKNVVLAMTGIGPVNATQTSTTAFEHFRCTFAGAVFSGVAGSKENIGDVAVPQRWTLDGGKSWTAANKAMVATARKLAGTEKVKLSQDVPVGDAACLCPGVDAATPVHMPQPAKVVVGGDGETSDPFGGHSVPCAPGGGDIAGCEPCLTIGGVPQNAATFASQAPSLADPGFWTALLQPPAQTTSTAEAQDEETAAVAQVAGRYAVPFLGIRAVSDGQHDPLMLPGFPWQFFVYRQLAGNNAAAVTIAFLQRWKG
jgi:nucleoside phosphorylase